MKSFAYALIPLVVAAWEIEPEHKEVKVEVKVPTSVEASSKEGEASAKVSKEAASKEKQAAVEKKN